MGRLPAGFARQHLQVPVVLPGDRLLDLALLVALVGSSGGSAGSPRASTRPSSPRRASSGSRRSRARSGPRATSGDPRSPERNGHCDQREQRDRDRRPPHAPSASLDRAVDLLGARLAEDVPGHPPVRRDHERARDRQAAVLPEHAPVGVADVRVRHAVAARGTCPRPPSSPPCRRRRTRPGCRSARTPAGSAAPRSCTARTRRPRS